MPKIVTAISSGMQPDLLWYAPVYTGTIAESGKLLAAEDLFKSDTSFDYRDIYPALLETGRYDGKIYTVPFETNCLAIYYNKKHFTEAGIDKLPETWDEFILTAQKLTVDKDGDGEPERFGFLIPMGTEEWTVWCWETFLWQAGGEILDKNTGKPAFHKEPGVKALEYWIDMLYISKCAVLSARNSGYKLDPFLSQNVSMMINGPWNYSSLKGQDHIEFGSFPMPRNVTGATNIGGENLYIFKSTDERQAAAWIFASYVMSREFQVDWAINTGYLPVNRKAAQDARYRKFLNNNPFVQTYIDSLETGRSRPAVPAYSRISKRIGNAIEKALYRKLSPEEALREAYEETLDIIDE